MSSRKMSATPLRIYPQNEFFTQGINQFKEPQRENDNGQQQITISPSICQSSNNLSPDKQIKQPHSNRNMSMLQLSVSRNDEQVIQCQYCNTKNDSLIQPCQCEVFYHSLCFKQKLKSIHGQFLEENLICSSCNVPYKIKKQEMYQSENFNKITVIVVTVIKFAVTIGGIAGFSYWLNAELQNPESMTSLVAIIVLLLLLFILYLIYLVLEIIRGNNQVDWEVLDQKQDNNMNLSPEELNLIEHRVTPSSSSLSRPQVLQQITNYPQIQTSEIIP